MTQITKMKFFLILFTTLFYYTGGNIIDIKDISNKLSIEINSMINEEFGLPFIEKLFNNFKPLQNPINPMSSQLKYITHKMENKIFNIFSAMENVTQQIVDNVDIRSVLIPCINEKHSPLAVLLNNTNELLISKSVLYQMGKNISRYKPISSAIKQEYCISENELKFRKYSQFTDCNGHAESIIWKNYLTHHKFVRKNIVLVLDHGGSLSKGQLQIGKSLAKEILASLNENDRVALIGVASDWSFPEENECSNGKKIMKNLTMENINSAYLLQLNNFIDSLVKGTGVTNHVTAMEKALDIIIKTPNLNSTDITMVIYISRGLLSSLIEAKSVLKIIAQQTANIKNPLYIHTCAVIDDLKPVMYETHFLRDLADQNFTKYNITFKSNNLQKPGYMLTINKTEDIGFIVNQFLSVFNINNEFNSEKRISLPYWDPLAKDFTISFTQGVHLNKSQDFIMIGVDIYFSNLMEDILYFSSNQQYSYAFLIDLFGRVLVHPFLLRASTIKHQISFVDISFIETVSDIELLRKKLITENTGTFITKNHNNEEVEFAWSRVDHYYVACIVINRDYGQFNKPFKAIPSSSVKKLLYQSLDGSENYKFCRHLSQIATLDVASLYLSKSCFLSPFLASRTSQGNFIDQGYLAYLKDDTGLIINPGFKKEIKDEVFALGHILDYLRKRHLSSTMSKFIVRRYASSYNGVLQMFPGSILINGLEITKRSWFKRALDHRGKITFIPPYLDKGGAGYIVTISYATPQLIISMDLTYGYMLKMLLNYIPYCLNKKISCFLIDDQGYIIYHRNLTDLNEQRPVEQQHIVHRESLVANDILNYKDFIKKLLCNDYSDNTIQRFYKLNITFDLDLVNPIPGEHCISYHLKSIKNTNLFIGIVNASCDIVPAFCPCSIVDRLCLNCYRMEQKECECPCECPLNNNNNFCPDNNNNNNNVVNTSSSSFLSCNNEKFEKETLNSNSKELFTMDYDNNLEICFPINCQNEHTIQDCLGLIGCEWCQFDLNSNLLKKPFCSNINNCFNGFYGLATPYRNHHQDLTSVITESDYSPLGPILGLIIAMLMLFILLYICYRSHTNSASSIDRLYLSSVQLRMSDLNVNTDTFHDHRDKLLKDELHHHHHAPSPYCVASNYRRNNQTTTESDHGYSTMTPHDESEHLSLAPLEADSLEDDVTSDSASVQTTNNLSSRNKNLIPHHNHRGAPPMFTRLPQRNSIIAPVTVHRNMESI